MKIDIKVIEKRFVLIAIVKLDSFASFHSRTVFKVRMKSHGTLTTIRQASKKKWMRKRNRLNVDGTNKTM